MPWTYENYDVLPPGQRAKLLSSYTEQFEDFDNDAITYSVATVLLANNISNFQHIKVGATRQGQNFDLAEQLTGKIDFTKQFTYFSLPTLQGRHSVAVVFDHTKKECYVIDSLGIAYPEAKQQLTKVISNLTPNYLLVVPQNTSAQTSKLTSGIHTAANIVDIIVGDKKDHAISGCQQLGMDVLGRFKRAHDDHSALVVGIATGDIIHERETSPARFQLAEQHYAAIRLQERFDSREMLVSLTGILKNASLSIYIEIKKQISEAIACLENEQNQEKKRGKLNCWNFDEFINKMPKNNPLVKIIVAYYLKNQPITISEYDSINPDSIERRGKRLEEYITHQMLLLNKCEKVSCHHRMVPEPINQPSYNIMFKILMGVMVTGITLLLVACLIALNVFSLGAATIPTAIGVAAVGGGFSLNGGIGLFWNDRSNAKDKSENCPPSVHATVI